MKRSGFFISGFISILILLCLNSCVDDKVKKGGNFHIGWSAVEITPDTPVQIRGMGYVRISEKVMDPILATALAMERGSGPSSEKAIMISCDLVAIPDGMKDGSENNLRDRVRQLVTRAVPELNREQIILNATHSHTAPECSAGTEWKDIYGIDLDIMSPVETLEYLSVRIAKAAEQAWKNRKPGGISFGLGHAVVARNRIQTDLSGVSTKGGTTNRPGFSHVEGYEDHTINLLYTWDNSSKLTGVVINIATDPQITGGGYFISADFWHDTRVEIHNRLGKEVFVLPQCSAAGDQGTLILVGAKAEQRMQEIMFPVSDSIEKSIRSRMGRRKQVASQISDAVTYVLPYMKNLIDWDPVFAHRMERVDLTRRQISIEEAKNAQEKAEENKIKYDKLLLEIEQNPEIKKKPRWQREITGIFSAMKAQQRVVEKYEAQKKQPKIPIEVHVLRIGDIAIATNPFELYLDYAMRIKARSPAIQTFVVQLAGDGAYLPVSRSVKGGTYGATPQTNYIGPEGGAELVEKTLEIINEVFPAK